MLAVCASVVLPDFALALSFVVMCPTLGVARCEVRCQGVIRVVFWGKKSRGRYGSIARLRQFKRFISVDP
jgi:predicted Rdx family selenoprotein